MAWIGLVFGPPLAAIFRQALGTSEREQREAIREPVRLAPYDPAWPAAFEAERERLRALFAPELRAIEHVGSTAIPGMPAKPIVDLLAGVESMAVADGLFERVLLHGYTTSRAFNEMLADRRWFMRLLHGRRTHHLHLVVLGSPTWREHLLFRDRLRSNAVLAESYARLKLELAERFMHDREAYTDAKSEFVSSVLALA